MRVRLERAARPHAEIVLHDSTAPLSKNVVDLPASLRKEYDKVQREYWVMMAELIDYLEGRGKEAWEDYDDAPADRIQRRGQFDPDTGAQDD
jgi:phosphate uptake regulator